MSKHVSARAAQADDVVQVIYLVYSLGHPSRTCTMQHHDRLLMSTNADLLITSISERPLHRA